MSVTTTTAAHDLATRFHDASELTAEEKTNLNKQEGVIQRYKKASRKVGAALKVIRDLKLFREDFESFDAYCQRRWDYSSRHVNRLIRFYEICEVLAGHKRLPANEAQARPLSDLKDTEIKRAWGVILEDAGDDGITAKLVRNVVDRLVQSGWRTALDISPPSGYESVFGETDGLRVKLPANAVPEEAQKNGMMFFDQCIVTEAELGGLPSLDLIREALTEMKEMPTLPRESAYSDIAARTWPVVVRDPLASAPYFFTDNGTDIDGAEGYTPTYQTRELLSPSNTKPHKDDGPSGNKVLVSPELDLFDQRLPRRILDDTLAIIRESAEWNFLFITNHPEQISSEFGTLNTRYGTTARNAEEAQDAAKKFGALKGLRTWLLCAPDTEIFTNKDVLDAFDWVVVGGLTDSENTVKLSWEDATKLAEAAHTAHCKLFFRDEISVCFQSRPDDSDDFGEG